MTQMLGVAQFAPDKGNIPANLATIAATIAQAAEAGCTLVVFPESAVSGYFLEGGADEHALTEADLATQLTLALQNHTLKAPLTAFVGYYEKGDAQPYNSVACLTVLPGTPHPTVHPNGSYRKLFLPTYGVFDEHRFHAPGNELGLFPLGPITVGVLICEDVWHSILGTLLAVNGADIVLVPSASPARGFSEDKPGNLLRYERMLRALAEEHGCYTAAAMLCGFEGGKGFVGGSFVFDPNGDQIASAPLLEQALITVPLDLETVRESRRHTPLLDDLRAAWPLITHFVTNAEPDSDGP